MIIPKEATIISFQSFIWQFYEQNKRYFAWRDNDNPYHILISEVMLQQTQTYRVESKFEQFIITFPSFEALANAELREILAVWQGLGYNRRAKYLYALAQKIIKDYAGQLPNNPLILQTLPGIGKATAGSICAFAFNQPTIFIETNIRTVFIHSFFRNKQNIQDKEIIPLIAATIDTNNPRQWYYALMDYGVYLKKQHHNPSRASAHHTIQSPFEGSDRQIRGLIIKLLTQKKMMSIAELIAYTNKEPERVEKIITQLCKEAFIKKKNNIFEIA